MRDDPAWTPASRKRKPTLKAALRAYSSNVLVGLAELLLSSTASTCDRFGYAGWAFGERRSLRRLRSLAFLLCGQGPPAECSSQASLKRGLTRREASMRKATGVNVLGVGSSQSLARPRKLAKPRGTLVPSTNRAVRYLHPGRLFHSYGRRRQAIPPQTARAHLLGCAICASANGLATVRTEETPPLRKPTRSRARWTRETRETQH